MMVPGLFTEPVTTSGSMATMMMVPSIGAVTGCCRSELPVGPYQRRHLPSWSRRNGNEGGINCGLGVGKIALGLFKLRSLTSFDSNKREPVQLRAGEFQITPTGFKPVPSRFNPYWVPSRRAWAAFRSACNSRSSSRTNSCPSVTASPSSMRTSMTLAETSGRGRLEAPARSSPLRPTPPDHLPRRLPPAPRWRCWCRPNQKSRVVPRRTGAETGQNDQNDGNDGKTHENHLRKRSILRHGRPAGSVHRLLSR